MKRAAICLAALAILTPTPTAAQQYLSLDAGGTFVAEIDSIDVQDDHAVRLAWGYDTGDWRVDVSAASLAAGISFHTVDAITYGVALYRDVELENGWTVYVGGGADYYDAHGVTAWPLPDRDGTGHGWRLAAGAAHKLTRNVTGFAQLNYIHADVEFSDPVTYDEWELAFITLGVRIP